MDCISSTTFYKISFLVVLFLRFVIKHSFGWYSSFQLHLPTKQLDLPSILRFIAWGKQALILVTIPLWTSTNNCCFRNFKRISFSSFLSSLVWSFDCVGTFVLKVCWGRILFERSCYGRLTLIWAGLNNHNLYRLQKLNVVRF